MWRRAKKDLKNRKNRNSINKVPLLSQQQGCASTKLTYMYRNHKLLHFFSSQSSAIKTGSSSTHAQVELKLVYGPCVLAKVTGHLQNTGRERLIRSHSSVRFCFELSGNSN